MMVVSSAVMRAALKVVSSAGTMVVVWVERTALWGFEWVDETVVTMAGEKVAKTVA